MSGHMFFWHTSIMLWHKWQFTCFFWHPGFILWYSSRSNYLTWYGLKQLMCRGTLHFSQTNTDFMSGFFCRAQ